LKNIAQVQHYNMVKSDKSYSKQSGGAVKACEREIQGQLFLQPPDTKLLAVLTEAERVYHLNPKIRQLIQANLDAYGRAIKATRLADAEYEEQVDQPPLLLGDATIDRSASKMADQLELQVGRPRTDPFVVYLALVLRGLKGSLSSESSWEYFIDSVTVQHFLLPYVSRMPGRSTLITLVNAISQSTREHILDCQLKLVKEEELDDLLEQTIDSTAVAGNSAWPSDIQLIARFIERAWFQSQQLPCWNLPAFPSAWPEKWLPQLHKAKLGLLLYRGKKKKKKRQLVRQFIDRADTFLSWLRREHAKYEATVVLAKLKPSRKNKLLHLWQDLSKDLSDADILLNYYAEKSLTTSTKEVEREDFEKIFSLSDGSSAFIVKGDRHATFGYKAQLSRSAKGMITAARVPIGNDADSNQLIPMVKAHIAHTGVTPRLVSADDGYASGPHSKYLKSIGVEDISISGAKGCRQLGKELWESKVYVQARADRSAVESTIGYAKQSFALRRCHRRGIDNVRCEILEKAIAFNFWRISYIRDQKKREEPPEERLTA